MNAAAQPQWQPTGYRFFPYAAVQSGKWWVLRLNPGFPEHDLYTPFVDGHAVSDLTHDGLSFGDDLEPDVAAEVVRRVADYVNYGSERGEPCQFCSASRDPMTRG